jgi:hypothetical protein
MERSVYQIAGASPGRSHVDVFLACGVALIPPGDGGPWSEERYAYDFAIAGFVRRFAEEIQIGDVLLLRTDRSVVKAVGIVASDYLYLDQFDDVNGLDFQHARRVRWFCLPSEYTFATPVFGASPTRCSRVQNADARDFALRFVESPPTHWQTAPLPGLPLEEPRLDAIPVDLRDVVAQVGDLVPLYLAGDAFGAQPNEHELVAHLVVPFLRALGWRPEQIAVEWRHIDAALFRELPRTPEHCHLVVEAKRLGAGVEGALEQAKGYVRELSVPRDVVVTDGQRYRMYDARADFAPIAYANLARLKQPASGLFARMRRP